MTDKIKMGTILIEEGTPLPESVQVESEPYANGWRLVKNLDGYGLDRKIREAGWAFFDLAQIKASVFGFDREKAVRRAVNRVLANVKWDKFNSLEISQVAAKRFLGLPYVTVRAHPRHIQESMFLLDDKRLAERNQAKLVAVWTGKGGIVSERNGDKARFGRERKKKNLQRQRNRELRKLLALENKATPTSAEASKEQTASHGLSRANRVG
jgi:hypothetical protein